MLHVVTTVTIFMTRHGVVTIVTIFMTRHGVGFWLLEPKNILEHV